MVQVKAEAEGSLYSLPSSPGQAELSTIRSDIPRGKGPTYGICTPHTFFGRTEIPPLRAQSEGLGIC